jgi:hypothetical protein
MVPRRFRTVRAPVAVLAVGSIALVVLSGACSKVPLVAPSGTVINLIATTNMLPINGSTDIVAVLVENGQQASTVTPPGTGDGTTATPSTTSTGTLVHNGTLVSFTTSLGRIEPAEAKTTGGQVTVKLVGDGRSGVATVTAYSGGASKTMTINIGAAAAARVVVTATPQALPPAGGTTTVNAIVQDQQGNPIVGVPVAFSTTAGSLANATVVTNAEGNATTTLATTAAATVTASAGGGAEGTALSGTVAITLQTNATLSLTAPATLIASSPATFTATIAGGIATAVNIDFGDGEPVVPLGAISPTGSTTHMFARGDRTYRVAATARFSDGQEKTITQDVVVADWSVTAACAPNPVTFTSGTPTRFTATVSPPGVLISQYVWTIDDNGAQERVGNPVEYSWQSRGTHLVRLAVVPAKGPTKNFTPCSVEVN